MHRFFKHLALFIILVAAAPSWAQSQEKTLDQQALNLLTAAGEKLAPMRVSVLFENGMYRMEYTKTDAQTEPVCPRGGDLTLSVGVETEVNVMSHDKIIRWVIPEAGLDVLAIPGRIESQRLTIAKPGQYQVKPPAGNTDKISDIPLLALSEPEFDVWFKSLKPCP